MERDLGGGGRWQKGARARWGGRARSTTEEEGAVKNLDASPSRLARVVGCGDASRWEIGAVIGQSYNTVFNETAPRTRYKCSTAGPHYVPYLLYLPR